jgi:hypothetical protein
VVRSPFWLDTRSIGAFRVALGVVLIADLLKFRWPNLEAFYGVDGILPPGMAAPVTLGVLQGISTTTGVHAAFALTLAAYGLYTFGFHPRLSGAVALWCLWNIHDRAPLLVATDDQAIICLLAWSLLLPLGEQFSVARRVPARQVHSVATCGIVLQIAIIYVSNAIPKTGWTWREGVAISFALLEDLWVNPGPAAWLAQYTDLCRYLTYAVRPVELSIAFLMVCPFFNSVTRTLAAGLVLLFHGAIFVFISVGFFPLITASWALLIVPSPVWDIVGRRVTSNLEDARGGERRLVSPSSVVAAAFLLAILGQNARQHLGGITSTEPPFMDRLSRTSLFRQYWPLYAPNATIASRWIKVRGEDMDGDSIDLWSGLPFTYDNRDLSYPSEPWQNLAYHVLYASPPPELSRRWARFEFDRWMLSHGERPLRAVHLVAFERTILAPQRTSAISWHLLTEAPGP